MALRLVAATAAALAALGLAGAASATRAVSTPDFGPNVTIIQPGTSTTEIKTTVDAIAAEQVDNEFGTQRHTILFMPGTYGTAAAPLSFQVGYYTEVAGLGRSPSDVSVNG